MSNLRKYSTKQRSEEGVEFELHVAGDRSEYIGAFLTIVGPTSAIGKRVIKQINDLQAADARKRKAVDEHDPRYIEAVADLVIGWRNILEADEDGEPILDATGEPTPIPFSKTALVREITANDYENAWMVAQIFSAFTDTKLFMKG